MSSNVIAIDGPAYVGKSQIAQALARLTGYSYINTGHMYRTIARLARQGQIEFSNSEKIIQIARDTKIEFRFGKTLVNNQDWTNQLDDSDVVLFASKIASIPELREILTQRQREYAQEKMIVMEGRDIGSVVFPDAAWKFYVTASVEIRARRMQKMIGNAAPDFSKLMQKVTEIDDADRNRVIAPLVRADDAILYDNSDSPDAEQDAQVLYYYLTHTDEIIQNTRILHGKQEGRR